MSYSSNDAALDAYDAARADTALAGAQVAAEAIAASFTTDWAETALGPDVSVKLDVGGDDQPLFIFSVNVELDDDLDADEYPMEALGELASELRSRAAASPVDDWAWLVETSAKARPAG